MKTCDICKKEATNLNNLRDTYATKDVSEICDACERIINNQLAQIQAVTRKVTQAWLQRFMDTIKYNCGYPRKCAMCDQPENDCGCNIC